VESDNLFPAARKIPGLSSSYASSAQLSRLHPSHMPRWLLLAPLWVACAMFLVRGIGNPIQSALIIGGGLPFESLAGHDAQAWNQWLLMDSIFFSPWFILGGFVFGATAWSAHRYKVPGFLDYN